MHGKVLRIDRPGGRRLLGLTGPLVPCDCPTACGGEGGTQYQRGKGFLGFLSLTAFQAEGCGSALRAQIIKKGARLRRRLCRRVVHRFAQGATAALPLRVADCRSAAMLIKSALRDWLSVSHSMISILVIGSLRSPPPFPLRGTSPASGSRIKHREIIFS